MTMKTEYRAGVTIGAIIAASLTVSGCLGPTYGTGTPATTQLIDDLGSIASVGSPRKGADIEYKPRPAIVKPTDTASLPAPQQNVAENNPEWVESPEETRARLVAEADANAGNAAYRSPLARRSGTSGSYKPIPRNKGEQAAPEKFGVNNTANQGAEFRRRRQIEKGAYSDRRRFLSDPPLTYRQPSETAPVGDLGEPERAKERRRISEAKKAGTGKRKWWPW